MLLCCSNTLTISRTMMPDDHPDGINQLECKTCPYIFILDRTYVDRHLIKRKEVDDVMGGPGAWDNVDQTDGE
ncbi:MAG: RNA polymerase III C11 subunit [Peltula sp. TS41687]|nr:MAG: RNA polymerase III C11 subunit [Peltula sp. TS41687]